MFSENVSSADNQQERLGTKVPGILRDCTPNVSGSFGLPSLLGLLYTDGCLSAKGKSWRLFFAVKSYKLVCVFEECVYRLFNVDKGRVRVARTKDDLWRAVVDSKEIGNYLTKNFGCFRTAKFKDGSLPGIRLPLTYLRQCNGIREFLSSAFSCDGGVSFYPVYRTGRFGGTRWFNRNVFLACMHPMLLNDYSFLLNSLGIKGSVLNDRIKISSREDMSNFQREVDFIKGVEVTNHSKLWRGLDKSTLLTYAINSYTNRDNGIARSL